MAFVEEQFHLDDDPEPGDALAAADFNLDDAVSFDAAEFDTLDADEYMLPDPSGIAGENLRDVAGQVGEVGTMVGKMIPPAVAGAVIGRVLPAMGAGMIGTALTGAVGGVVGGIGSRAVGNAIEGNDLDEGTTLGAVGLDALLGGGGNVAMRAALPLLARGGRAVGRGVAGLRDRLPLRTGRVGDLPGFDDATSLRSDLPDVEPMPLMMHDQPDIRVARDDLEMGMLEGARTKLSAPAFVLRRSQNSQAAQIAGRRLDAMGADTRSERALAHEMRAATGIPALDENERRAVTVALGGRYGDLPPAYQTERVADAAQRARHEFYDAASEKLTANRAATIVTTGDQRGQAVPYRPRADYVPWIPNEQRAGTVRIRQLLANRGRTPQTMFQRTGERGPVEQAIDELNGIEGPQPTNWITDADEAMRVYIEGGNGRVGYPELVARSRQFGPITEQHPDAEHPWGTDANVLYQQMLEARAPFEAELFKQALEPVYRPTRASGFDRAATWLKDRVSHTILGQTALTQLPQSSTPVWRHGIGNDIKGKYDWLADDSYRELGRVSGAQDAGFAREMGDVGTVPRRATEAVERGLRGFGNAGLRPYLDDIAGRVQDGAPNAATRKMLEELNLGVGDFDEGVTAPLLKRAFESSAHRNQFHPYDPGQSGSLFMEPAGKLATQFQPFGHAALRNVQEDVLEPLLGPAGWRAARETGDYSLQTLGAQRAARLVAAGAPAAIATELAKAAVGLREPEFANMVDSFMGSNLGTPGMLASSVAGGYDPTRNLTLSPVASMASQQYRNLAGGHPERTMIDAAAWADPTGWMSVLRPTLQNLTKEDR